MFNNKVFLITGGTGSFGRAYTKFLLNKTKIKKVIIFSRDEQKQFALQNEPLYVKNKESNEKARKKQGRFSLGLD